MARPGNPSATRTDWAHFARWCVDRGEPAIPAGAHAVAEYVREIGRSEQPAEVTRRVAVINEWHRSSGLPSPTDDDRVRLAVTRARHMQRKPTAHTIPIDQRQLETIVASSRHGLVGARDRALLLVGYAAALRPSELVSLDVSDVVVVDDGLSLDLLRGRIVVPYNDDAVFCPVLAWQDWVVGAGLTAGPAFRSVDRAGRLGLTRLGEKAITRIVQRAAERAGLGESRYSALSLRLGMLESAPPG
jgi:integrase